MSSFLYALSLPVVLISSGLLLRFNNQKIFSSISMPVLFSGFFYLVYVLLPYGDFPLWMYVVMGSFISIFGCVISFKIHKVIIDTELKLRNALENLIKFALKWRMKLSAEQRPEYSKEMFETFNESKITK